MPGFEKPTKDSQEKPKLDNIESSKKELDLNWPDRVAEKVVQFVDDSTNSTIGSFRFRQEGAEMGRRLSERAGLLKDEILRGLAFIKSRQDEISKNQETLRRSFHQEKIGKDFLGEFGKELERMAGLSETILASQNFQDLFRGKLSSILKKMPADAFAKSSNEYIEQIVPVNFGGKDVMTIDVLGVETANRDEIERAIKMGKGKIRISFPSLNSESISRGIKSIILSGADGFVEMTMLGREVEMEDGENFLHTESYFEKNGKNQVLGKNRLEGIKLKQMSPSIKKSILESLASQVKDAFKEGAKRQEGDIDLDTKSIIDRETKTAKDELANNILKLNRLFDKNSEDYKKLHEQVRESMIKKGYFQPEDFESFDKEREAAA